MNDTLNKMIYITSSHSRGINDIQVAPILEIFQYCGISRLINLIRVQVKKY